MLTVLRQRNFALMWWGGLISFAGDWMMMIARPVFVYELTGSALATSLMFVAGTLPRVALGSVAGVFVDRWDRQRTMVIANVLLGLSILPLLLVHTPDLLWIVYLSAFVTAVLSQFLYPAENAFLPTLVTEEHLVAANSANSLNNQLARLVGPALGGVVMAQAGFGAVVAVDTATFLIAGLLIGAIKTAPQKPADKPEPETIDAAPAMSVRRIWQEWLAGLHIVRENHTLTTIFIVMAITSVGEGMFSVLLTPFATGILKTDAVGIGTLMSAQAIGGIVGGVIIARMGERLPLWGMAGWGCFLLGLIDMALINYSLFFTGFWFAVLMLVVVGVPAAAAMVGVVTLLQQGANDAYRGRVFGALMTTTALASLVGIALAGTLGEIFGPLIINLHAILYMVGGGLMLLMRRPTPEVSKAVELSSR